MKNIDVINRIKVLEKYADSKLPQKISYAISRNLKYLNEDYKIYQESLSKLFNEYADYIEKDESGQIQFDSKNGLPLISGEKDGEFKEELAELLSIEVDTKEYKISQELFDYDDGGKYQILTVNDINLLMAVLCEDE